MKKINVLSLCDGISCGMLALKKAGIEVNKYYASEIKENAIKVSKDNFPEIIQLGDVNNITYKNGVLSNNKNQSYKIDIDMLIFGSPCQSFSIACKTDKRVGLKNKEKSGLFLECLRLLEEINPKYFLFENVASMKDEDKEILTEKLTNRGGQRHKIYRYNINSKILAPALRNRLYWTNFEIDINKIKKKDIVLKDILTSGYSDRDKARCLMEGDSRPLSTPIKMFHRYYETGFTTLIFKSKQHYEDCVKEYNKIKAGCKNIKAEELNDYMGNIFNGVRYMNQEELEQCQTLPIGYTKVLNRNQSAGVIGDAWTVDIISEIFKHIKDEF